MNWHTSPLSERARAILTEEVSGRAISGISASFFMNLGITGGAGLFPPPATSLRKASHSARRGGGRDSSPPGAAMAARNPSSRAQREAAHSGSSDNAR